MKKSFMYKSLWELSAMEYFDYASDVVSFDYETLKIPYKTSSKANAKEHFYLPDFIVIYDTGQTVVIEIKPKTFSHTDINKAKFKAAKLFCRGAGYLFKIWTDDNIEEVRKILVEEDERISRKTPIIEIDSTVLEQILSLHQNKFSINDIARKCRLTPKTIKQIVNLK